MDKKIAVARCHEIQIAIKGKEVARFESIPAIGMAVQLALHIRGLPIVDYERVKLVASTVLGIPRLSVDRIVVLLEEIGFVKIQSTGKKIQTILPTVPFFDDFYERIGGYLEDEAKLDEFETLTLEIVDRLAMSPHNTDALAKNLGVDRKAFNASIEIGEKGSFVLSRRSRSKTILLNPTYFSENADLFADHVAKCGAFSVKKTLELIRASQGWLLSLIERQGEIAGTKISKEDINLLKRLAQEGVVKPPSINISHAGQSMFIFTPTPGSMNISPLKRDQYEKSLAIVSALRQGQLLPNRFAIRSPGAVLYKLKTELKLRPTTDYGEQYKNLVHLRIAQLVPLANGYRQLEIIDTPDNREALNIAYNLLEGGGGAAPDQLIDDDALKAMTGSQEYVESLVSSKMLREREKISLSGESEYEIGQLLLEGF